MSLIAQINDILSKDQDIMTFLKTISITHEELYKTYDYNSSGSYLRDILSDLIERIFQSEDQHLTKDLDQIWFCNKDQSTYASLNTCNNIIKGIYWLITDGNLKIKPRHIKYLHMKIIYQLLYEYDTHHNITPTYIYKKLNTLKYMLIHKIP